MVFAHPRHPFYTCLHPEEIVHMTFWFLKQCRLPPRRPSNPSSSFSSSSSSAGGRTYPIAALACAVWREISESAEKRRVVGSRRIKWQRHPIKSLSRGRSICWRRECHSLLFFFCHRSSNPSASHSYTSGWQSYKLVKCIGHCIKLQSILYMCLVNLMAVNIDKVPV